MMMEFGKCMKYSLGIILLVLLPGFTYGRVAIVSQSGNRTAISGQPFTLACQVEGGNASVCRWKKNGQLLARTEYEQTFDDNFCNITIETAGSSSSWQCLFSGNSEGEEETTGTAIWVKIVPKTSSTQTPINISTGESFGLLQIGIIVGTCLLVVIVVISGVAYRYKKRRRTRTISACPSQLNRVPEVSNQTSLNQTLEARSDPASSPLIRNEPYNSNTAELDFLENVLVQLQELKQQRVRDTDSQGYQIPNPSRNSNTLPQPGTSRTYGPNKVNGTSSKKMLHCPQRLPSYLTICEEYKNFPKQEHVYYDIE